MEFQPSSIGQSILVIDKYMKLYLRNSLRPHNLNTAEGMVLLTLFGRDGKTQNEILNEIHQDSIGITQEHIIDELHYDKSVMTRTMQSLEGKGYVKRQENISDGRSYIFYLTQAANDFKPTLISILRYWNDGVMRGFDDSMVKVISETLLQLAENAKTLQGRIYEYEL